MTKLVLERILKTHPCRDSRLDRRQQVRERPRTGRGLDEDWTGATQRPTPASKLTRKRTWTGRGLGEDWMRTRRAQVKEGTRIYEEMAGGSGWNTLPEAEKGRRDRDRQARPS